MTPYIPCCLRVSRTHTQPTLSLGVQFYPRQVALTEQRVDCYPEKSYGCAQTGAWISS